MESSDHALAKAIKTANRTATADTLDLAGGCAYALVAPDNAGNGLPVITSDITVDGQGATIRRDASAPGFRILAVAGTGTLTLNGVTISGGKTLDTDCPGAPGAFACGGGISNLGRLTVNAGRVIDNIATSTIYAEAVASTTTARRRSPAPRSAATPPPTAAPLVAPPPAAESPTTGR